MSRTRTFLAIAVAAMALAAGCSNKKSDSSDSSNASDSGGAQTTLTLGYFPNVTHATPIVGLENGIFAEKLGDNVKLETKTFNAGGDAVTALLSGAIDATYIGPNPSINAWDKSDKKIKIISGAASGGAFLVVKPDINSADDLKGKKIASPQLGNTQDVALRWWLKDQGLSTDTSGGGDVSVVPQENAQTLGTFEQDQIDGAWVPEPWATRVVNEGGGKILIDEASLWPDGRYVTTDLIVNSDYLNDHPDVIKGLLEGSVAANEYIEAKPDDAAKIVSKGIEKVTSKPIDVDLVSASFDSITFTDDPIASSLIESANHAEKLSLLDPVDLDGIYDLGPLNKVLKAQGKPAVSDT